MRPGLPGHVSLTRNSDDALDVDGLENTGFLIHMLNKKSDSFYHLSFSSSMLNISRLSIMNGDLPLFSSPHNVRPQPHGHTSQQWEAQKINITRLYALQNLSLKDVVEVMKAKHSFFATYVL